MRALPFISLLLLTLTACAPGQMPDGWDWNAPKEAAAEPPAPLQRNKDFDQRLAAISQKLETEQRPWQSGPSQPNGSDRTQPVEQAPLGAAPIKVALIVPLSGAQKDLGNSMMVAGQMALQDLRVKAIELLPRDSGDTPASAEAAVKSAINEGAKLVLGPVFAEQVKTAGRASTVPLIGFTTDWTAASNNTFVMGFLPYEQVRRVADFAAERQATGLLVVAPDSPYGRAVARTATEYNKLPTKMLIAQPADTINMMVAKIRAQLTPQTALLIAYDGVTTRRLVANLSAAGITPKTNLLLGTGLLDDPQLASAREVEGVYFASAPTAQRARFESRYRSVANKQPARLASLAYDATALAAVVAASSGNPSSPFSIADIKDTNGFAGVDGIFRFQDNGLVSRGLAILTWQAGQLREISPAPASFQ